MPFRRKISLLGTWNLLMIAMCLGSFAGGITVFLCWVQLIRYLEYTKNPLLISFLIRKVIFIQAALIINVLLVLTGFVMFSMVVFAVSKKFEDVKLAYFEYIFNDFQSGIYENFLDLSRFGGFAQSLYYCFLFYMMSCANQMLPSILCNLVISRGRYKTLQEFMSNLKVPCPVCQNITNNSSRKRGDNIIRSDIEESRVLLDV
jgi:hypothetical protein